MTNNNLFLNTARLAAGPREDHLTEFLAAALATSAPLRRRYAEIVLTAYAAAQGWAEPVIVDVQSQYGESPGIRPDMVLTLRDGKLIACEHKLDAPEGVRIVPAARPAAVDPDPATGPSEFTFVDPAAETETEKQGQLTAYLNATNPEFAGLLYVRQSPARLKDEVLKHPRYIRPALREGAYDHFLWRDVYPALSDSALSEDEIAATTHNPLVGWLREGFVRRGWVPLHPFFGDLESKEARSRFGTYWRAAETSARRMGWRVGLHDFQMGVRFGHPSALAKEIILNPRAQGDGRFRVGLMPARPESIDEVERRLRDALAGLSIKSDIRRRSLGRVSQTDAARTLDVSELERVVVVEAMTTLDQVFGDVHEGEAVERRLNDVVRAVCTAMIDSATP